MASGGHREGDRQARRSYTPDRGRREYRENSRERHSTADGRGRESRRDLSAGDAPRRGPPVCFGYKVIGHYRSDCWRFWTDPTTRPQMEADGYICPPEFGKRGRSASPLRAQTPTMVNQPAAHNRIDEIGRSVASLQEYVEMERVRRMEREQRRREREEARRAKEEFRRAEEERRARKAEKQRKQEEEKMAMAKAVEVQLSLRLGGIREDIHTEVRRAVTATVTKNQIGTTTELPGKGKEKAVEDVPSSSETASEVEAITEGTEKLTIQEKRKTGEDLPVGDSPKVTTPTKCASRKVSVRPLCLADRLQRNRTRVRKANRGVATRSLTAVKQPARDLAMERMVYLDQTRRELSKLEYDRLRAIRRDEDVNYTTKVQAIFDIADQRALLRYGEALPEPEPFVNLDNVDGHSSLPHPRVRGHVRFRLRELPGLPPLLANANNVPKAQRNHRLMMLGSKISEAFKLWPNAKGQSVLCSIQELSKCMTACCISTSGGLDRREVFDLKTRLDGLVLTPLDWNPGETLVMCPLLYYEGMMSLFIRNDGYLPVEGKVSTVLEEMKADLELDGLTEFARWDKKGTIGQAYAMPKHKDLDKFRPICPSYPEPTARTSRVVAKGLNHLLFNLPQDWHFNLKAVSDLKTTFEKFNWNIEKWNVEPEIEARSFDIKDMFSLLPHQDILDAVDWILDFHTSKNHVFVGVNTRGRGATFGQTTGYDHWRRLDFGEIRKFVVFELTHTFRTALGVLLQQKVGIPMGKSTSPPLACIMCARA
ncbi:hypothetical protein CBR_g77533, partial [Chara braunii]